MANQRSSLSPLWLGKIMSELIAKLDTDAEMLNLKEFLSSSSGPNFLSSYSGFMSFCLG